MVHLVSQLTTSFDPTSIFTWLSLYYYYYFESYQFLPERLSHRLFSSILYINPSLAWNPGLFLAVLIYIYGSEVISENDFLFLEPVVIAFTAEAPFGGGVRGGQMHTPDFPGGPSFHHKGPFAGHNNPLCPT